MAEQPLGVKFLLRRLRRAATVPAAERSPEVAAFVESVQLLREACDLLPLASDCSPALQLSSAEARQQATLALLKAARADYICPANPVSDRGTSKHFEAYCCRGLNKFTNNELTLLLLRYTFLKHNNDVGIDLARAEAAAMLDQLAAPAVLRAISGQLAQLASAYPGQPLLTFDQLHYVSCCWCCRITADYTVQSRCGTGSHDQAEGYEHTTALAQRREVVSLMRRAAAPILTLEPQNPKSYYMAAATEMMDVAQRGGSADAFGQQVLKSVELLLRGSRLARKQGSLYYAAICAADAVKIAACRAPTQCTSWQAAVAAFEGVEAVVLDCKRQLPAPWVAELEGIVQPAQQAVAVVQKQLESPSSAHVSFRALASIAESTAAGRGLSGLCDGCGQRAVGLRRCGRCRLTQYCSTECQHKHWRTHKRECRKA